MKRIRLLALGGTIACRPGPAGLDPCLVAAEIAALAPPPAGTRVDAVDFRRRTILFPSDWTAVATEIFALSEEADGFVLTCGTDTLAWLGAALTLALPGLPIPVVLTGAMIPPDDPGSDAGRNLGSALIAASHGPPGVFVAFGGRLFEADSVTKLDASSPRAFESPRRKRLGAVSAIGIRLDRDPAPRRGRFRLRARFEPLVATLRLEPTTGPADVAAFERHLGVLVEGFGDGNVASHLVPAFLRLREGRVLILGSRCGRGALRHAYEGGHALREAGIPSADGLTSEAAFVRLSWALGEARDLRRAEQLFRAGLPPAVP